MTVLDVDVVQGVTCERLLVELMLAHHAEEFEIGKKYLANMMGADPENFTQAEIDVGGAAVAVLSPSCSS